MGGERVGGWVSGLGRQGPGAAGGGDAPTPDQAAPPTTPQPHAASHGAHLWPLCVQLLRQFLVWVGLYGEGGADRQDLEEEGQVGSKGGQRSTQQLGAVAQQGQQGLPRVAVVGEEGGGVGVGAHPVRWGKQEGRTAGRLVAAYCAALRLADTKPVRQSSSSNATGSRVACSPQLGVGLGGVHGEPARAHQLSDLEGGKQARWRAG